MRDDNVRRALLRAAIACTCLASLAAWMAAWFDSSGHGGFCVVAVVHAILLGGFAFGAFAALTEGA